MAKPPISGKTASGRDPGAALAELAGKVRRERGRILRGAGMELVREIKLLLSTPGRGRIYKIARVRRDGSLMRSKRTGKRLYIIHRASAPGDPPAVNFGQLRNSIQFWMDEQSVKARVGTNVKHAAALEFGTMAAGGYIAPRPFMRPALARVHKRMGITVARELRTLAKR